jgi:hypothetical protein
MLKDESQIGAAESMNTTLLHLRSSPAQREYKEKVRAKKKLIAVT